MRPSWLAIWLASVALSFAAEEAAPKPRKPCTIKSPTSGLFDLSGLAVLPREEGQKPGKNDRNESWLARGYDYGVNYTINICAPVIEELEDVDGVPESQWKNVSAFYTSEGRTYSLGSQNSELVFRGRKLVLNYTEGSPCGGSGNRDSDDESPKHRKSMIISFFCDNEPYDSSKPKVAFSFVGASPDLCHYSFEARSALACGGAAIPTEQSVGPGSLFGIIMLTALAVYVFGGIAYQRNVMHQRGWRQIPNYSLWAGVASFFSDIFIIFFSSCARCLPGRRGYNQLPNQNSRGRGASREDENRLIDQLDEEWDD